MIGETEMESMYGTCRFCGQTRMIEAADQQDADIKATRLCTCPDARLARKKAEIREMVQDLCGAGGAELGFTEMTSEQADVVLALAEMIVSGKAISAALRIADSSVKISTAADGELKFSRNRMESMEARI